MSIFDIVILAALAVAVGFALRAVRKGKGGCGGDCAGCSRHCVNRGEEDSTPR